MHRCECFFSFFNTLDNLVSLSTFLFLLAGFLFFLIHFHKKDEVNKPTTKLIPDVLKGRVYPAIQQCVSNRYLIFTGFFGFYGLLIKVNDFHIFLYQAYLFFISILWVFIAAHNLFNYVKNAEELVILEGRKTKEAKTRMESWFFWVFFATNISTFLIVSCLF